MRNAPSAGTESIDRIGKCFFVLAEAITSSSKNDDLVVLTSQIISYIPAYYVHAHWTALPAAPIRPIAVPGHDTLSRDIMRTSMVRYRTGFAYSQILR